VTALRNWKVALSISDAPDRSRLGYPDQEITRVLFSICTALIRAGAGILYSGDLRPTGYTFKMFRFLVGAYAGQGMVPFEHIVPEPVLRKLSYDTLYEVLSESRGVTTTIFHLGGKTFPVRRSDEGILVGDKRLQRTNITSQRQLSEWLDHYPVADKSSAYLDARQVVTSMSNARIAIGGKMGILDDPNDKYEGARPGIVEESIITLQQRKPLVVLGAFGGASRDIAIALNLLDKKEEVPRKPQETSYHRAIDEVRALSSSIPTNIVGSLRAIAKDDRAEAVALSIVEVLNRSRDPSVA